MASVVTFMDSPLIIWVKTFSPPGESVDFQDMADGTFLNEVFMQIDQRECMPLDNHPKDVNTRIQNWTRLLKNISNYYKDILQQIVTAKMPNVVSLVKEPTSEASLRDLQTTLLLILGCAVQCDRKENFINTIKSLDLPTQQAMVEYIKQITDSCTLVMNEDLNDSDGNQFTRRNLYPVLSSLSADRDMYAELLTVASQERDYFRCELENRQGTLTAPPSLETYHLMKEVNQLKAKTNEAAEEIEDKLRLIAELKEENTSYREQLKKVKAENVILSKDAKTVQSYRDEVDVLREKAMQAERLEKEKTKYMEKLNELEFFKSRVQELREDNNVLVESRSKLEDQVALSNKKLESMMDELVHIQVKCDQANNEKEEAAIKIQKLLDENAALEFEHNALKEGSPGLRRMQSFTSSEFLTGCQNNIHSISEELNETMVSRVSRLEMENDELRSEIEESQSQLVDMKRQMEQIKKKTEQNLISRTAELEHETFEMRQKKVKELEMDFKEKLACIEHENLEERKRVERNITKKVESYEQQISELRGRVRVLIEMWNKDKERVMQLEKKNKTLKTDMEEIVDEYDKMKLESSTKIKSLESQLKVMRQEKTRLEDELAARDDDLELTSQSSTSPQPHGISIEINGHTGSLFMTSTPIPDAVSPSRSKRPSVTSMDTQTQAVQQNNAHTQSSAFGSVRGRVRTPQARGVVAPQQRSITPVNGDSFDSKPSNFSRNDKSRSSFRNIFKSSNPFSRDSKLRASMPEKKLAYVAPKPQYPRQESQHPRPPKISYVSTPTKSRTRRSSEPLGFEENPLDTSMDSGNANSPESDRLSVTSEYHENQRPMVDKTNQMRHSFHTIHTSSDTKHFERKEILTTKTAFIHTKNKKSRELIDKILELQNANQEIRAENGALKRQINSAKFNEERLQRLEEQNLELDGENRRLSKIVEMLQQGGSGLYDKRTYHFYSNV